MRFYLSRRMSEKSINGKDFQNRDFLQYRKMSSSALCAELMEGTKAEWASDNLLDHIQDPKTVPGMQLRGV